MKAIRKFWRRRKQYWELIPCDYSVHIVPANDSIAHWVTDDFIGYDECVCWPEVSFVDPEDGEAYARPIVTHHSLDGREKLEGVNV